MYAHAKETKESLKRRRRTRVYCWKESKSPNRRQAAATVVLLASREDNGTTETERPDKRPKLSQVPKRAADKETRLDRCLRVGCPSLSMEGDQPCPGKIDRSRVDTGREHGERLQTRQFRPPEESVPHPLPTILRFRVFVCGCCFRWFFSLQSFFGSPARGHSKDGMY